METLDMDTQSNVIIPVGRGASVHGTESGNEDDDEMWERAPLDLPDTCDIQRAASPAPSYLSMESESMDCSGPDSDPDNFSTRIELERPDSAASSVYSLESDEDVDEELKAELKVRRKSKGKPVKTAKPELILDPAYKRHPALTVKYSFKFLQQFLKKLSEAQLKYFKKYLWERYPEFFRDPLDGLDILDLVDKMLECCGIDLSFSITLHVLQVMGLKKYMNYICAHLQRNEVRYALKKQLKQQYSMFYEGCPKEGGAVDFESICAEHYMTTGLYAPVNHEHELRGPVEELKVDRRFSYTPLKSSGIYDPAMVEQKYLRLLVMRGGAGIGKTAAVHRFILDWVAEKSHEEIYFVFPLSGVKLLPKLDVETTFRELLNSLFPCLKDLSELDYDDCQLMFILDDIDELLHNLDFLYTHCWCDVNTTVTVRILLINLIKGHLLHNAYLWVVTRPLASCRLPSDRIHQVIEVRGFAEEDREAYFRKRHSRDPSLAERMVTYLRANKTLFIMCHLPMFCWVVSNVLQKVFQKFPPGREPPSTLTELYTHLLQVYFNIREKRQAAVGENWEEERQLLMKVGKLAYTMLEKEVFHITKSNWKDDEADPNEAILRFGLCTEYYREKFILYQEKIRCFIHPTMQEYLAALYVFLCYKNHGKNVLDTSRMSVIKLGSPSLADLYKSAIDKAVHSKAAAACHYDLFLRFLMGLGAQSNQRILGSFINHAGCKRSALEDAAQLIRKKIKEHPDRAGNLKKCLEELCHGEHQETQ